MKREEFLGYTADRLGGIKAQQSDLAEMADGAKAILIEAAVEGGIRAFEGLHFRATVSFTDKTVVDYKAILAHLEERGLVEAAQLAAIVARNTARAEGVPCVRVVAKKGV